MKAEIITIGTELLLGEIVDTNSAWIAQQLAYVGMDVFRTVTVGDNLDRISAAVRTGISNADLVITTGGLGPTVDDMTREAIARATDRDIILNKELLKEVAAFFAGRGRTMSDSNRKQATIPAGAEVIHNPVGTAPAFAVTHQGSLVIALPGVPHEMRYLIKHAVMPLLHERYGLQAVIASRVLRTCGIGESTLGGRIPDLMEMSNPTVGTAAHPGQTDIRITAKASSRQEADALIAPIERAIQERLGEFIFGVDQETLAGTVLDALAGQGLTLASAETATHGDIAAALLQEQSHPGTYAGGYSAPSADAVAKLMGRADIDSTEALAHAVREKAHADLGLAAVHGIGHTSEEQERVQFCLAWEGGVAHSAPTGWRSGPAAQGWLVYTALDLVRRHLLQLPTLQADRPGAVHE
ncbi:MAG: CinA family nicotinamide mononucleotide deamidase-related protein [Anaerolineae bacterium]